MSAITYGWDTGKKGSDAFWLRFDPCTRKPLAWKEELFAAARVIANRAKKPIWICSSGGIDSEIACRAFFDQGIHFSVLTLEHEGGTNTHDMNYALKWCKTRNVPHKIVKIDAVRFLTHDVEKYTDRYPAYHPFRYLQIYLMELVENMGGFGVLCSGEQLYQADLSKPILTRDDIFLPLSNGNCVPLEWCKNNTTDHEPYFHFSTPELCLSYLEIPIIDFALSNPDPLFRHLGNAYALKRIAYQALWPDLEARNKYHGFENIRPLYDASTMQLRERFKQEYIPLNFPVTLFEKQLRGTI